jgi:hypothetical protein
MAMRTPAGFMAASSFRVMRTACLRLGLSGRAAYLTRARLSCGRNGIAHAQDSGRSGQASRADRYGRQSELSGLHHPGPAPLRGGGDLSPGVRGHLEPQLRRAAVHLCDLRGARLPVLHPERGGGPHLPARGHGHYRRLGLHRAAGALRSRSQGAGLRPRQPHRSRAALSGSPSDQRDYDFASWKARETLPLQSRHDGRLAPRPRRSSGGRRVAPRRCPRGPSRC